MNLKVKRVLMALFSVTLLGCCGAMLRVADFGMDTFTGFGYGALNLLPKGLIGYGTFYVIMNIFMLAVVFAIDKHYIGIGTLMNLFGIGYIIQYAEVLFRYLLPEELLWVRVVLLIVGTILLSLGASMYFTADVGVSAYDAIALIMTDKKIGRYRWCRIGTDLFCVIFAFFAKVNPGIGTLISALCLGPFVEFFNEHVSRPLLGTK